MRHLAALTALLVVLAGCSGAPGGDAAAPESTTVDATTVADGTTTTDAATETTTAESTTSEPADETETASATDPDRPPGLSASGVANAEALAAAHADALANESYTYRREATVVAANGSELGHWRQRVQVGPDRLEFNFTQTAAGVNVAGIPLHDSRVYTNGSMTYGNASVLLGGYTRSEGRGFAASRFDGDLLLAEALNGTDTSVRTVERDGETLFLVRVHGERERVTSAVGGQGFGVEIEATNLTATALVAPSGFVRNLTYEYDFERGNVTGHRTETLRYAAVGETTVERPAWVADAEAALPIRLPPGLSASGVTDAEALAAAHASALVNTSYTVVTTLTARDGAAVVARQNATTRVVHDPTRSFQRVETAGEDPASLALSPADVEVWSDENGSWWAIDRANGTTYRRMADDLDPAVGDRTGRDRLYVLLTATDTTLAGTTTENGTTLYRVRATGGDDDLLAQTLDAETVANLTASILVGEDGVVRRYRVTYDATVGNVTARVTRTVRFTALGGTTVERPGWYDEAVNATADR